VADRGWKRSFDDPIPLPRGRQLVTLEDAGNYITELPEAVHEAKEWQAAMEALILVVTLGGPTMFARIGVMRALNRHVERVFDASRKETCIGDGGSLSGTNDEDHPALPAKRTDAKAPCELIYNHNRN
jgi:hypothetical protein